MVISEHHMYVAICLEKKKFRISCIQLAYGCFYENHDKLETSKKLMRKNAKGLETHVKRQGCTRL